MIEHWKTEASRLLGDFRVFRLRQDRSRSPHTGNSHDFYVLEAPDWINVVPVTPEGKVVLIRQYRHGADEVSLEIPGGMVDAEDGDPVEAARRELLEETGYAAEAMIPIGVVTPNPAILDNYCYTYLAHNVRRVGEPQFDGTEYIEVELHDLASIPQLIATRQITHALVIAAFYHYEHAR